MKKANREPTHFSMGERGKYVKLYRKSVSASVEAVADVRVWAPLVGFEWAGSEYQIADDTWIKKGVAYRGYESDEFANFLSRDEREECREIRHWLSIVQPAHYEISTKASVNLVLIALWIVRPTRTSVPLRFEEAEAGFRTAARVHERFQWIDEQAAENIKTRDLDKTRDILQPLRTVYKARQRLRNALVLTFRGCLTSDWQSAFICFAAGVEALLTYSRGPGLTDRLARAYAKIACNNGSGELAKEHVKKLYLIRSDIVHGRAYDRKASSRNLRALADFSDVLRSLWRTVLEDRELSSILEGDDRRREEFFLRS